MTKFIIFNVQLLPTDENTENIGPSGYKKLLASLRDNNNQHRRNKTLHLLHEKISTDSFFGPDKFNTAAGYVYGSFIKYTRTNEVSDLNRRKVVYQNKTRSTTISKESAIPFLFDTKHHYLAIDGGAGIKIGIMSNALKRFFEVSMGTEFPDYQLHVNLVSSSEDIERILEEAVAFKRISLDITFQNGSDETQGFLREMRASRTQKLHVDASGGDGKITKLPSFMNDMVRAAVLVGSMNMTYYVNGSQKKQEFDSTNAPLTFTTRMGRNDDEASYFLRVRKLLLERTHDAEASAKAAHEDAEQEAEDQAEPDSNAET